MEKAATHLRRQMAYLMKVKCSLVFPHDAHIIIPHFPFKLLALTGALYAMIFKSTIFICQSIPMSTDVLVVLDIIVVTILEVIIMVIIVVIIMVVTILEVIIMVIMLEWRGGNLCHEPLETVNHGARELTLVTECEIRTAGKGLQKYIEEIQKYSICDCHNILCVHFQVLCGLQQLFSPIIRASRVHVLQRSCNNLTGHCCEWEGEKSETGWGG